MLLFHIDKQISFKKSLILELSSPAYPVFDQLLKIVLGLMKHWFISHLCEIKALTALHFKCHLEISATNR